MIPAVATMPPKASPIHSAVTVGWVLAKRESSKVGSRKCSRVSVTPGMPTYPPMIASTASGPMAAFIGRASSAK